MGSALGLAPNTKTVFEGVNDALGEFKDGVNPARVSVAAVQADFVAHSLGGLITRNLKKAEGAVAASSYGQGIVHKLITIDSPHLGSPLGRRFMQQINDYPPGQGRRCVANLLALTGNFVFQQVTLPGVGRVNGSVFDLVDQPLSQALTDLGGPGIRAIPASMLVGYYTEWDALDVVSVPVLGGLLQRPTVPEFMKEACPLDPIAQAMTSTGWPLLMGGDNDGIVPVSSQHPSGPERTFPGRMHGEGTRSMGFTGEAATSNPENAAYVIELLNEPVMNTNKFQCLPAGATCRQ
jgi:hypothetical protein